MKKQLLLIFSLIGLIAFQSWSATHGFVTQIINNSPYKIVRIQTTDSINFITYKGKKLSGDQIQDQSFMLSDINDLNLIIPWQGWDGGATIRIDVFRSTNFSDPKSLVWRNLIQERDGKVQLKKQAWTTSPEILIHEECRNLNTNYAIEITSSGEIRIASTKVNKNPGEVDRCNPDWAHVTSGLYVGTCGLAGMKQTTACADWCDGSIDNVLDWECRGLEQWCLCKPGVSRGSHLQHKVEEGITTAANAVADAAKATSKFFKEDVYEVGLRDNFYGKFLKPAGENINKYGKIAADITKDMVKGWFRKRPHHDYCNLGKTVFPNPPTIDSAEAKKVDTDGLLPYIEKYSPVAWIEGNEDYYPMTFSEYILAPTTSLISRESTDTTEANATILAPGQITMEKLYDMSLEAKKNPTKYDSLNLAFKIDKCTTFGANPDKNMDSEGNLTTPIYAVTYQQNDKLYIQYLFFYGYNGAYNVGPFKGPVLDIQDFHEGDLEHITMELDKSSKKLERIYYSSHGSTEGFWIDVKNDHVAGAKHSVVEYEGTHPVAYIAHYSHAIYPREGTYVRIFGVANDVTSKSQKWLPKVMRLYDENDKRFDPKTMGFMYFPGNYGVHGVQHMTGQGWFMNPNGDIGRPIDSKGKQYEGFCNNPPYRSSNPIEQLKIPTDFLEYEACIAEKIPFAKPPA